ncbi:MAG TPA: hypothetical protein VFS04_02680 [Alphaproteobacteria bacterium]|nr:hypothetical protein [Alphaproteobacteria bacterium]
MRSSQVLNRSLILSIKRKTLSGIALGFLLAACAQQTRGADCSQRDEPKLATIAEAFLRTHSLDSALLSTAHPVFRDGGDYWGVRWDDPPGIRRTGGAPEVIIQKANCEIPKVFMFQ